MSKIGRKCPKITLFSKIEHYCMKADHSIYECNTGVKNRTVSIIGKLVSKVEYWRPKSENNV